MVKRVHKSSDGLYHVNGGKFKGLIGSRAQVMHSTVYKTKGGLTKNKLKFNKHGKIVSRAKSSSNPLKRLTDAGYRTKKGEFGSFHADGKRGTRKRGRTRKKRRTGQRRTKKRRTGKRCRTKKGKFRKC